MSHNSDYLGITADQERRHEELMAMPTNHWPPDLIAYVRAQSGPFCGDALARYVADWIKGQA